MPTLDPSPFRASPHSSRGDTDFVDRLPDRGPCSKYCMLAHQAWTRGLRTDRLVRHVHSCWWCEWMILGKEDYVAQIMGTWQKAMTSSAPSSAANGAADFATKRRRSGLPPMWGVAAFAFVVGCGFGLLF